MLYNHQILIVLYTAQNVSSLGSFVHINFVADQHKY